MRTFIVTLLLLAVTVAVAGFNRGWFQLSPSLAEQKSDFTLTVDQEAVSGWFEAPSSAVADEKDSPAATVDAEQQARTTFLQRAESRLTSLELRLGELQDKAKHGRAVTKDRINQAIDELTRKTASARLELRELNAATHEGWDVLKARLGASLHVLEDACERAFAQFMNEDACARQEGIVIAALRIGCP